jgi:hypothetical protein
VIDFTLAEISLFQPSRIAVASNNRRNQNHTQEYPNKFHFTRYMQQVLKCVRYRGTKVLTVNSSIQRSSCSIFFFNALFISSKQ